SDANRGQQGVDNGRDRRRWCHTAAVVSRMYGENPFPAADVRAKEFLRMREAGMRFVAHLHEVPVLVGSCVEGRGEQATDELLPWRLPSRGQSELRSQLVSANEVRAVEALGEG